MGTPSTVCPKWSGAMEFGLLIDSTYKRPNWPGPEQVLEWVRGTPKQSWWNMSFKTQPGDRLQVATLRCTACGYLELYAPTAD